MILEYIDELPKNGIDCIITEKNVKDQYDDLKGVEIYGIKVDSENECFFFRLKYEIDRVLNQGYQNVVIDIAGLYQNNNIGVFKRLYESLDDDNIFWDDVTIYFFNNLEAVIGDIFSEEMNLVSENDDLVLCAAALPSSSPKTKKIKGLLEKYLEICLHKKDLNRNGAQIMASAHMEKQSFRNLLDGKSSPRTILSVAVGMGIREVGEWCSAFTNWKKNDVFFRIVYDYTNDLTYNFWKGKTEKEKKDNISSINEEIEVIWLLASKCREDLKNSANQKIEISETNFTENENEAIKSNKERLIKYGITLSYEDTKWKIEIGPDVYYDKNKSEQPELKNNFLYSMPEYDIDDKRLYLGSCTKKLLLEWFNETFEYIHFCNVFRAWNTAEKIARTIINPCYDKDEGTYKSSTYRVFDDIYKNRKTLFDSLDIKNTSQITKPFVKCLAQQKIKYTKILLVYNIARLVYTFIKDVSDYVGYQMFNIIIKNDIFSKLLTQEKMSGTAETEETYIYLVTKFNELLKKIENVLKLQNESGEIGKSIPLGSLREM